MKQRIAGLVLFAFLTAPAFAQAVSEARGSVQDRAGNPIAGAVVTFRAKSKPDVAYQGISDKKGRYIVSGLFTAVERETWTMECKVEGFVPAAAHIESRTAQRVLVGDILEVKLKPSQQPPEIPIRPLGFAVVDWTVVPVAEVEAELQQVAEAAAAAVAVQADAAAAAAPPAKDPWVEALTLASAGSLAESVESFREAVELDPGSAERHETFAKILYRLEHHAEAAAEAQKAVEIEPTRVESWLVLSSALDERGDIAAAQQALAAAAQAVPREPRIQMRMAQLATREGDNAGATAAYTRVTEGDPDNAEAWLALAQLHAEAGRLKESEEAYARVAEIDPQAAHQTYYNLGATIIKRDNRSDADTRRAVEAFRRALEIKPDYSRAASELAIALIGLGDLEGARAALESFIGKNPSSPEAAQMKAMIQSLRR